MNRKMPSKGCDPTTYNSRVGVVKEAKAAVKRVRYGDPVVRQLALVILHLVEARRDAVLAGLPDEHAGLIRRDRKEDWVLRA